MASLTSRDLDFVFRKHEQDIAPGVRGCTGLEADTAHPGRHCYVVMWVRATNPGNGDVTRWLDSLPSAVKTKFVAVVDDNLAAALERRGFKEKMVPTPQGDGWIGAYIRMPAAPPAAEE